MRSYTRCVNGCLFSVVFFFQAEDCIRDLVRSRGLGDVYKRQPLSRLAWRTAPRLGVEKDALEARGPDEDGVGRRLSLIHI